MYLTPILELKSLLTHLLLPHASRSLGVPSSNDASRQGSVRFYRLPINPLAGWSGSTPWAKRILATTYFRCRPGFCKSTPNHEPQIHSAIEPHSCAFIERRYSCRSGRSGVPYHTYAI